ncbi:MAG: hypothetical protein WAU95_18045, partial [Anaerolineae bacterium]
MDVDNRDEAISVEIIARGSRLTPQARDRAQVSDVNHAVVIEVRANDAEGDDRGDLRIGGITVEVFAWTTALPLPSTAI